MSFNADDNIATVTLIEAKDIPAADPSGFSDPYMKAAIVPAGKKEYKTKVFFHPLSSLMVVGMVVYHKPNVLGASVL